MVRILEGRWLARMVNRRSMTRCHTPRRKHDEPDTIVEACAGQHTANEETRNLYYFGVAVSSALATDEIN